MDWRLDGLSNEEWRQLEVIHEQMRQIESVMVGHIRWLTEHEMPVKIAARLFLAQDSLAEVRTHVDKALAAR